MINNSQTRLVFAWQFAAELAAFGVGVAGVALALAALQAVRQADAACALPTVAYELLVAYRLPTRI
jgi:hypothetical protein